MQKKKGISLIVLVITIIVMIILAAAVVIAMSNNGIIERASHAVKLTDEKQVQDLAALVWAEAYLDEERTDSIEKVVKDELEKHGVTDADWDINVTETGVIVKSKINSGNASVPTIPEPIVITSRNYPNLEPMSNYTGYTILEYWNKDLHCDEAAKYKVIISEDTMVYYDEPNDIGDSLYVDNFTQLEGQMISLGGYGGPTNYQGMEVILDNTINGVLSIGWCSYRGGMFKIFIYPLDENGNYLTDYDYTIDTTTWN